MTCISNKTHVWSSRGSKGQSAENLHSLPLLHFAPPLFPPWPLPFSFLTSSLSPLSPTVLLISSNDSFIPLCSFSSRRPTRLIAFKSLSTLEKKLLGGCHPADFRGNLLAENDPKRKMPKSKGSRSVMIFCCRCRCRALDSYDILHFQASFVSWI